MLFTVLPRFIGLRHWAVSSLLAIAALGAIAVSASSQSAGATPNDSRALTLLADIQEANANTGVLTARGNVQILYPARQIQATAAQAQYFSRERRIVLTGNVYVLQQGNSLRGETITYLIDEGRFVALPKPEKQVESIYIVPDLEGNSEPPAALPSTPEL